MIFELFSYFQEVEICYFFFSFTTEMITKMRKLILYKIKRYAFHSVIGMQ